MTAYIYYICTHCWNVALISRLVIVYCPLCAGKLSVQEDLDSAANGLERKTLELTVWRDRSALSDFATKSWEGK